MGIFFHLLSAVYIHCTETMDFYTVRQVLADFVVYNANAKLFVKNNIVKHREMVHNLVT